MTLKFKSVFLRAHLGYRLMNHILKSVSFSYSLLAVLRLWTGPDSLRPQLRRPQPASGPVRGSDSTASGCSSACRHGVRQRAEPQCTGIPSISTLTFTSGQLCKILNRREVRENCVLVIKVEKKKKS